MANNFFFQTKEHLFKRLFLIQDKLKVILKLTARLCDVVLFMSGLLYLALLIVLLGFSENRLFSSNLIDFLPSLFIVAYIAKFTQEIIRFSSKKRWANVIEAVFFVMSTMVLIAIRKGSDESISSSWLSGHWTVISILGLLFFSELYKLVRIINSVKISPPLLFALSFLVLIFVGSGLLLLPDAHVQTLSYTDALFTSASAVCVTGLVVVDTCTAFTQTGQIIILSLIQIGGLGIMAFTGFFAFAFTGSVSFKDRILLKDIFSADTLSDIFRLLFNMMALTFTIEAIGAVVIYFDVREIVENPIFFSVFHAISAFCNAGFSTIQNGLANELIHGNNILFLTVSFLIIIGGIGFPVLIVIYTATKHRVLNVLHLQKSIVKPGSFKSQNISYQLVLVTTAVLLVAGTLAYYLLERNNSLHATMGMQQWVISFFGSVSARTAGFNIVDVSGWNYATIFVMIILMWIGASPGSTGGGIKTTTIGIAAHAVFNFVRGRHQIEIGYRQIGSETISRVLVVIVLSIVVISAGFFALLITDPLINPVYLLFETVSAFGTVGLSIANTSTLSSIGKYVIIGLMFIGRVGPLTLLSGIFVSHRKKYYRYPEHDLVIN